MKSAIVATVFAAAVLFAAPVLRAESVSAADASVYRDAFAAAKREDFAEARRLAARAGNPLLAKAVRWKTYIDRNSGASFAEIAGFVRENPDWPWPNTLQRRAEEAISIGTPAEQLLPWFKDNAPVTVDGKIAYGQALLAKGRREEGVAMLRDAWISGNFGTRQERQFQDRHESLLRQADHHERLTRLLWDGHHEAARRLFGQVDSAHRLLAEARIALQSDKNGVDAAVDAVPAVLADDPGLIHDRVKWRRKKELDDLALELLRHKSADKVRPESWWNERSVLARRALQRGLITQAYETAAHHGMSDGGGVAEAEWFAGWIALRYLQDKDVALRHFKRMYDVATTPISQSRGAYWMGRGAEAMKDAKAAAKWYQEAARFVTTYYGQLAAARLQEKQRWPLPADPFATQQETAAFDKLELVRVVRLLAAAGLRTEIDPFILRLNDVAQSPGHRVLAAKLAIANGRQDLAVSIARRADRDGVPMISYGYPVPPFKVDRADRALVLALIRQESNFHVDAVSHAGARGLMQLMPATARWMAKREKVAYSPDKLHDPDFNLHLGTAYLADLLDSFRGSMVLSLAGYNAGPGRARQWVREYGDPRDPDVDAVDWVENIPFNETRNYVQRVMEGLQIYRRRLGMTEGELSLEKDLKR